jgi:orotate phosphoribosyltransferase
VLADMGVRQHHLATWWDVLAVAKKNRYFDATTLAEVEKFLHQPAEWSTAHGGTSRIGA